MEESLRAKLEKFVEENIAQFHSSRVDGLQVLKLKDLLQKKNPYLFRAKDMGSADGLIRGLLDARLSSSEEGKFGTFLEHLAIFISQQTRNGRKSVANGLDIELEANGFRYLIAVKSGKNWGNSSQHKRLKQDFQGALKIAGQHQSAPKPRCVLGICYGRFGRKDNGLFETVGGKDFWELISGDPDLYKALILPLGHRAKEQNESFATERDAIQNRLVREFTIEYCGEDGSINWDKLIELVSKNIQPRLPKTTNLKKRI